LAIHTVYPSRSSNPLPSPPVGLAWPEAVFGVGATAPGRVPALGPQMPASLLALAMLARSGPLLALVVLVCTPALAVAVDQSEPKASPPLAGVTLATGFPRDAIDVDDVYEGCLCVWKLV